MPLEATRDSRRAPARLRDLCAGDGERIDLLEAALALSTLQRDEAIEPRRCASMSPRSRPSLPTWCTGAARCPSGWAR